MRFRSIVSAVLLSLGGIVACSSFDGTDDANPTTDPNADGGDGSEGRGPVTGGPGTQGIVLSVKPLTQRFLVQDKDNEVPFTLSRVGDSQGEVTITASDLPSGATAAAVTLPPGVVAGIIEIHPSSAAAQGPVAFHLKAVESVTSASSEAPVTGFIRGHAGTLDTTFASNGTLAGGGRFFIDGMDRIYAFGSAISRFDIDGKPAPGAITDPIGGAFGIYPSGASQMVACAGTSATTNGFYRFNLEGDIDQGFGTRGFLSAGYGGTVEADDIEACGVSPTGQLAIVVATLSDPAYEFFTATGAQMNDYSAISDLSASLYTSSGFVGAAVPSSGSAATLNRVNYQGADTMFGSSGKVVLTGATSELTQIVEDSTKRLVAVGPNFIGRVSNAGVIDSGFANTPVPAGTSGEAHIAIAADGKIVRAQAIGGQCVVLRYNTDGTADMSFGTSGYTTLTDMGCAVTAVGIFSDGRILLGDAKLYRVWAD